MTTTYTVTFETEYEVEADSPEEAFGTALLNENNILAGNELRREYGMGFIRRSTYRNYCELGAARVPIDGKRLHELTYDRIQDIHKA